MNSFRILLVDDHAIVRYGLCSLLRSHPGWEICGEAADGWDALEKCNTLKPDLVLLDISMPKLNGLDVARKILKHDPDQKILILTDVASEQVILDCLEAGVRGWVFKSDATEDLIKAVEALQRNKSIFSSRVSNLFVEAYKQYRTGLATPKVPELSPREREVVQLVGEGKSSKEIAVMLSMTVKTVDTHRSNILRKLKLHSVAELVLYAVRNHIIHVQLPELLQFPQAGNGAASHSAASL